MCLVGKKLTKLCCMFTHLLKESTYLANVSNRMNSKKVHSILER